jgi:acyl dehydratase
VTATRSPRLPVAFEAGAHLRTPARTLTEADFSALINVSWENGPLHTDAEHMRGTTYGRTMLGGPCLVAVTAGLTSSTLYASWYAAGVDCHAALGIDEVRYLAPVHAGDTVHVEIEVAEMRPTEHGTGWFGRVEDRLVNDRGEDVLTMKRSYLLTGLASEEAM